MSSRSQNPEQNEASFEDVLDLGSIPPPPGVVGPDVHAARTAIAAMPTTLLEELRRAKAERGGSFTNEAPTRPGKDGLRMLRPIAPDVDDVPPAPPASDFVSAVKAALPPTPPPRPTPPQPARPPAAIVKTPPMAVPAPPVLAPPTSTPLAAPVAAPAVTPDLPPITTPMATPAPMPAPMPASIVAPMSDQLAPSEPRPPIRFEVLLAIVVVVGSAVVLALAAIAARVLSHP